jgi:hypothetical protein
MVIVKHQLQRVVANRFYGRNSHLNFTCLQYFLARAMSKDFGGWRVDAQKFTAQGVAFTPGIFKLQLSGAAMQFNPDRFMLLRHAISFDFYKICTFAVTGHTHVLLDLAHTSAAN